MRSQKLSESRCFIVPLLNWKKIESHFETYSSDAQQINLTFVAYSSVTNFVRYIAVKHYLNWFSFHTVIMKVLEVNFFLKHGVYTIDLWVNCKYVLGALGLAWGSPANYCLQHTITFQDGLNAEFVTTNKSIKSHNNMLRLKYQLYLLQRQSKN